MMTETIYTKFHKGWRSAFFRRPFSNVAAEAAVSGFAATDWLMQTLHDIPRFRHLSPDQLHRLRQAGTKKTIPANHKIVDYRGSANHLIVIESGHVEVRDHRSGRYRSLWRGDWLFFGAEPNLRSLYCKSRVKLHFIPQQAIQRILVSADGSLWPLRPGSPLRSLLSIILPALLTLSVAIGLFQMIVPDSASEAQWVFDRALLPFVWGAMHLNQGNLVKAETYFRQSLAQNRQYSPAHHALATIYYEQGQNEAAIEHWSKAVQFDPGFSEAYRNLSLALSEQGKVAEAITALERAIRLTPNRPALYRALGEMYLTQENTLQARRAFLEASRLDQTDAGTFYKLGYLYLVDKDYDRALHHFNQALTLNSTMYLAEQGLGVVHFEQHRFKEALQHFQRATALYPDDYVTHFYTGLIFEQQGQYALAKTAFSQVVQLNPPPDIAARTSGHIRRLSEKEGEGMPMDQ